MPDVPVIIELGRTVADAATGGSNLIDESLRLSGASASLRGIRPAEFEFSPAQINAQVDKAISFPHVRGPNYGLVPAVDRFPELEGPQGKTYDAVIAGAGLMGAQAARVLAADGKSVAVLEGGLVADGASGALAGMGTRGLDASYPELKEMLADDSLGERLGGDPFRSYVRNVRNAGLAIRSDAKPLSASRTGISSHMYSYEPNDEDLIAEYKALHGVDRATSLALGADAARLFPAVGSRPPAGTVLSFLGESRVNPREFSLSMLDHPNITTFEHSPVVGIRTGLPGQPIEIHTPNGMVKGDNFISATGSVPSMFHQHVPLLGAEQARMIRGVLPDGSGFTRDNWFDFGNPVSRNDEDYAWWLMPKPGEVYLGADSRFLTDGDRATRGTQGLRENMRFTFPQVTIPRGEQPWGSVIYSTDHGGPLVDTLPNNSHVIVMSGGGGTGLVNGRQAAWAARDLINGRGKNPLYAASTLEKIGDNAG